MKRYRNSKTSAAEALHLNHELYSTRVPESSLCDSHDKDIVDSYVEERSGTKRYDWGPDVGVGYDLNAKHVGYGASTRSELGLSSGGVIKLTSHLF